MGTLRRSYCLTVTIHTREGLTAAGQSGGAHLVVQCALAGCVLSRVEKTLAVVLVLEDAGGSGDAWNIALAGSAVAV